MRKDDAEDGFIDIHWSEKFADQVIAESEEPFVLTAGLTNSGPAHVGSIAEPLYTGIIRDILVEKGHNATFYYVADIRDAFDGVPADISAYRDQLESSLGKPLSKVQDPLSCHSSLGEHYLSQIEEVIKILGIKAQIVRSDELYDKGHFDQYTRIYLEREEQVKSVVAESSLKKMEDMKNWSPVMPICQNCGRIATTRVTSHDNQSYSYTDDGDAGYTKGCGFSGINKITDHQYKLQWRLHWPTWQAYFNTSIEGSGVDHMTRGGSADTAIAIHKQILHRKPPILYKYGFILLYGKKYSKSKGFGMTAVELVRLIPPEVLRYMLIQPYPEQNKDIDPTGDKLISVYNEVERINVLSAPESRAEKKKLRALRIAAKKLHWKAHFVDVLLNYQIYRDWDKVAHVVDDAGGVKYLAPYIEAWLEKGMEPERYNFTIKPNRITELKPAVEKFASNISDKMSDVDIHNLVYQIAADNNVSSEELFKQLYLAMIGKEQGPKLGKLVSALGIEKTQSILKSAIS